MTVSNRTSTLHIVHGGVENGDKKLLEKVARRGRKAKNPWIVPKSARIGDDVVIYMQHHGFFATAKVTSHPVPSEERTNRYVAEVNSIRLIEPAISLATIKRKLPTWIWTKYPRSITTLVEPFSKHIRLLIADRRKTGLPDLNDAALKEATLDELRKVALLKSKAIVGGKDGKAIYRARSLAVRLYVLQRANGCCEGCQTPAPFLRPDSSPYLEPHHTTQLSDGGPDHPARVIALCPNCHSRAHYAQDKTQFNNALKKKLSRLEPRRKG